MKTIDRVVFIVGLLALAACGPNGDVPPSPCENGNRDGAFAPICSADTCVSRQQLQSIKR